MNNPNLDKFAIAAAAIIILGFIGYAVLAADPVAQAVEEIEEYGETIEEKGGPNQTLPSAAAPDVLEAIRPMFNGLDESATFSDWAFARRPGQARLTEAVVVEASTHTGPKLTKIEQKRDATLRRPIHVIEGVRSSITHGELTRLAVEMRETGTDQWSTGATIPAGEGAFSVQIVTVEQGKAYDYRVVSIAKSTSQTGFGDPSKVEETLTSGEYSSPVPYDEFWEFTSAQAPDLANGTPGSCWLTRKRFDYDKMAVASVDGGRFEAAIRSTDLPNLPKVFDTNFRLRRVVQKKNPSSSQQEWMVELVDIDTRDKLELWASEKDTKILEASDVIGDSADSEDEEGGGEDAAENPTAKEVTKPKPKPKPPTDDDDDF